MNVKYILVLCLVAIQISAMESGKELPINLYQGTLGEFTKKIFDEEFVLSKESAAKTIQMIQGWEIPLSMCSLSSYHVYKQGVLPFSAEKNEVALEWESDFFQNLTVTKSTFNVTDTFFSEKCYLFLKRYIEVLTWLRRNSFHELFSARGPNNCTEDVQAAKKVELAAHTIMLKLLME